MKNNILEYKGYHSKIEFDTGSFVLRGKIEGINDLVDFQSDSIEKIEQEFQSAVDDYLEFCKEVGKEPDKEYKGSFNIRISPELHKRLALVAIKNGDTLNASVEKAIIEFVSADEQQSDRIRNTAQQIVETLEEQVCRPEKLLQKVN